MLKRRARWNSKKEQRTSFQMRNLVDVCEIVAEMMRDRCAVVLGLAGSVSSAGYWTLVTHMIEKQYVDVIVSTGANISEDIIDALSDANIKKLQRDTGIRLQGIDFTFYEVDPHSVDDRELNRKRLDRFYDHVISEDAYIAFEKIASHFMCRVKPAHFTASEYLAQFGKWLSGYNVNCIISTAARHGVPVFCPALSDSGYLSAYVRAFKEPGDRIVIDQMRGGEEFFKLLESYRTAGLKRGAIYIGGGVPKNFIQSAAVLQGLVSGTEEVFPYDYAVQIIVDAEYFGGLSGASVVTESVSWGKESENTRSAEVHCDFSIALPFLMNYLKKNRIRRVNLEGVAK